MLRSHVIEIDGAFVGAAVRLGTGYRFVATDPKLEPMHGMTVPSLADIRQHANRLLHRADQAPTASCHAAHACPTAAISMLNSKEDRHDATS